MGFDLERYTDLHKNLLLTNEMAPLIPTVLLALIISFPVTQEQNKI